MEPELAIVSVQGSQVTFSAVQEQQCSRWDCYRRRMQPTAYCSYFHEQMAVANRDMGFPLDLQNVFVEISIENISKKIISALKHKVEPGVPVLTKDVMESLPWKSEMFIRDLEQDKPNYWMFCSQKKVPGNGRVKWEERQKKGKHVDEWMLRGYTPFPKGDKSWELKRFSSHSIPEEALYTMKHEIPVEVVQGDGVVRVRRNQGVAFSEKYQDQCLLFDCKRQQRGGEYCCVYDEGLARLGQESSLPINLVDLFTDKEEHEVTIKILKLLLGKKISGIPVLSEDCLKVPPWESGLFRFEQMDKPQKWLFVSSFEVPKTDQFKWIGKFDTAVDGVKRRKLRPMPRENEFWGLHRYSLSGGNQDKAVFILRYKAVTPSSEKRKLLAADSSSEKRPNKVMDQAG